jgi:RHS repeat-associated protein
MVGGELYRYAFQGQEKDPETGKEAFQLRLWDSRIGRWLTTDPAGQYNSPYWGMGNNPIRNIDPDRGTCYDAVTGAVIPCNDIGVSQVHDINLGTEYVEDWDVFGLDEVFVSNKNDWRSPDLQYRLALETEQFINNIHSSQREFGIEFLSYLSVINPWSFALGGGASGLANVGKNGFTKAVTNEIAVSQYSLRAAENGLYPVMKWGEKYATELAYLERGEVWKYGTTKTLSGRYTQKFLTNNKLLLEPEFSGTIKQSLQLERMKIMNHFKIYKELPFGNKMIK